MLNVYTTMFRIANQLTGSLQHCSGRGIRFSFPRYCRAVSQQDATSHKPSDQHEVADKGRTSAPKDRFNAVGIQMLSNALHEKIFKDCPTKSIDSKKKSEIDAHLRKHGLHDKKTTVMTEASIPLPPLFGTNIDEHFRTLALQQISPYGDFADSLAESTLPLRPKHWILRSGWTKYDSTSRKCYPVNYPDEDGLVFDVEVLMTAGSRPTMATAVSKTAWYSWCGAQLFEGSVDGAGQSEDLTPEDLLPLETSNNFRGGKENQWQPRVVIGHNVGFDRSFIREQYYIMGPKTRFIDTMSLHIAVSGLTSLQRMLYVAKKAGSKRKEVLEHEEETTKRGTFPSFEWTKESSLNNLSDVYQLYCKGPPLEKHLRDVFITGNIEDVKENFQSLMSYCSEDVKATHAVFHQIWPEFKLRFPHPVTLAGMLEMGTAYLPVNHNWKKYIDQSQAKFDELQQEVNTMLCRLAENARSLLEGESYKKDVWLWDLDWSAKKIKFKKSQEDDNESEENSPSKSAKSKVSKKAKSSDSSSKQLSDQLYPKWFSELCTREWSVSAPTPSKLTMQRRVAPKLLRLLWDGFPLHYDATHGWGYLVPCIHYREEELELMRQELELSQGKASGNSSTSKADFPFESLIEVCMKTKPDWIELAQCRALPVNEKALEDVILQIQNSTDQEEKASRLWEDLREIQPFRTQKKVASEHIGEGPFLDVVPNCEFYKLPHKDGAGKKVGNPLAKDFRAKIEQGVLRSLTGNEAETVLKFGNMCSYWKNNVDRIRSQIVIKLSSENLPEPVTSESCYTSDTFCGAIIPRVITAGTVTRRAVEATWLTASNAYTDRIGSELKAMIQSPPGYHFVGADVDSQELWIAAILGDAYFAGEHGCSAFGWMTLQGNKAEGTDLHSKTAHLVGITREHAKVFNYGRIYGAGQKFAEQMLMKFNHRLTKDQARTKARAMFQATKGRRVRVHQAGKDEENSEDDEQSIYRLTRWEGGSESHMFNMLEEIARSEKPQTPVLGCYISKSLEPRNVNTEFMTSRVNWVVQSSAVDYLHLMLVCMRWLLEMFQIDGRFCISIHDEVRYLIRSEDRYRAALALQITNLLTRSMFAYKLGMMDLPQSVAFFSSVDIDTCLRKEVTMDCVTPSNPLGLDKGYEVPPGEALDIYQILKKTNSTLNKT